MSSGIGTNYNNYNCEISKSNKIKKEIAEQSFNSVMIVPANSDRDQTNHQDNNLYIIIDGEQYNVEALLNNLIQIDKETNTEVFDFKAFESIKNETQKLAIIKYLYAKNQYEYGEETKRNWNDLSLEDKLNKIEQTKIAPRIMKDTNTAINHIVTANYIGKKIDSDNLNVESDIHEGYEDYIISYGTDEQYAKTLTDAQKNKLKDAEFETGYLINLLRENPDKLSPELQKEYGETIKNYNGGALDTKTRKIWMQALNVTSLDLAIVTEDNNISKGLYSGEELKRHKDDLEQFKAYQQLDLKNIKDVDITDFLSEEQISEFEQKKESSSLEEKETYFHNLIHELSEKYKDDPESYAKAIRVISLGIGDTEKSKEGFMFARVALKEAKETENAAFSKALVDYIFPEAATCANDLSEETQELVADKLVQPENIKVYEATHKIHNDSVVTKTTKSIETRIDKGEEVSEDTQIIYTKTATENEHISNDTRVSIGHLTRSKLGEKANNYGATHSYKLPKEIATSELNKYLDPKETKHATSNTKAVVNAGTVAKFDKDLQQEAYKITSDAVDANLEDEEAVTYHNALIDQIKDCHIDNQKSMYEYSMQSSNEEVAKYAKQAFETNYTTSETPTKTTTDTPTTTQTTTTNYQTNPITSKSVESINNSTENAKSVYQELLSGETSIHQLAESFNNLTSTEKKDILKSLRPSDLVKMPIAICALCPEFIPQFVSAGKGIDIIKNVPDAASDTIRCMKKSNDNDVKNELYSFMLEYPAQFMKISVQEAKEKMGIKDDDQPRNHILFRA